MPSERIEPPTDSFGDLGTAHVIHDGEHSWYLDATVWTVELVASNSDPGGNRHYLVADFGLLEVDHEAKVVRRR